MQNTDSLSDGRAAKQSTSDTRLTVGCFALQRTVVIEPLAHSQSTLSSKHADALANLLPLLMCGEESAALVFDALHEAMQIRHATQNNLNSIAHDQIACDPIDRDMINALRSIADDEYRHDIYLCNLKVALPKPSTDEHLTSQARRFFLRMADRNVGRHFARIVALDSAVCTLLGEARKRSSPIAADPLALTIFTRIHYDEGHHVRIAKQFVNHLLSRDQAQDAAVEARCGLTALLHYRASALETLEVDTHRLFDSINNLPRGLFA